MQRTPKTTPHLIVPEAIPRIKTSTELTRIISPKGNRHIEALKATCTYSNLPDHKRQNSLFKQAKQPTTKVTEDQSNMPFENSQTNI